MSTKYNNFCYQAKYLTRTSNIKQTDNLTQNNPLHELRAIGRPQANRELSSSHFQENLQVTFLKQHLLEQKVSCGEVCCPSEMQTAKCGKTTLFGSAQSQIALLPDCHPHRVLRVGITVLESQLWWSRARKQVIN